MRPSLIGCFFVSVIFLAGARPAPAQTTELPDGAAPQIPVSTFAKLPDITQLRLSPGGTHLAYLSSDDGRPLLVLRELKGGPSATLGPIEEADIYDFRWANNDRLLVFYTYLEQRYNVYGRDTQETRLLSIKRDGSDATWLVKPSRGEKMPVNHTNIVSMLPDDPDHILLALDFQFEALTAVYRVNVNTGRRRQIQAKKNGIFDWVADQTGMVRLGFGFTNKKYRTILRTGKRKWVDLDDVSWGEDVQIGGFGRSLSEVYALMDTPDQGAGAYRVDLTGETPPELLFSADGTMLTGFATHPVDGRIIGVRHDDGMPQVKYFDEDMDLMQRSLECALVDQSVSIRDKISGMNAYLIFAESDRNPGTYFVYDRDQKQLSFIAAHRERLDADQMAATVSEVYEARDGMGVEAFVTWPRGTQGQGLPTVIYPHGGPHARSNAEWDFIAQMMANRGYLVIQPNFRGSTGYGEAFMEAGEDEWGGLMQRDIADAARWAIAMGYADPDNICIVGGSFGGYSALIAPVLDPGLFQCAVSFNGVADIPRIKNSDRRKFAGGNVWVKTIGKDGNKDAEISPYHRVAEIDVPVLLFHAKDDIRVDWTQSTRMAKALQNKDKSVTLAVSETGGHGLYTEEARLTFLQALDGFLAENLSERPATLAALQE